MHTKTILTRSMSRGLVAWAVIGALALGMGLTLAGCGKKGNQQASVTPGTTTEPNPTAELGDPLAIPGTIDDSGKVTPGTIELSKSAGSRVQWKNIAHDTMMIILKDSHVAELVPPGQFSAVHRVCLSCETGFYHYDIKRMVKGVPSNPQLGPPTEPQLGVGD